MAARETKRPGSFRNRAFLFPARPSSRHRPVPGLFVNNLPQARRRYWPDGALQKRNSGCAARAAIRHFGCAYAPPPAKPKVRAGGMCTGSRPVCSEKTRRRSRRSRMDTAEVELQCRVRLAGPGHRSFVPEKRGFESRTRHQNPSPADFTRQGVNRPQRLGGSGTRDRKPFFCPVSSVVRAPTCRVGGRGFGSRTGRQGLRAALATAPDCKSGALRGLRGSTPWQPTMVFAPLAQWIRAAGFYPAGRPFESVTRHQIFPGSAAGRAPGC